MTEEILTSAEQATVPQQQGSSASQPAGASVDWENRYKGSVKKLEELTLANRELNNQLAAKTSELEQLRATIGMKDTEKTVAVGERDKLLQTITEEKSRLENELTELRGLKLKVEAIRELGRPELLKIADRIPILTDKETLKTVLQDFAGFADELVKQREQQLLSGITPQLNSSGAGKSSPSSEADWEKHINSLDLGSKDRAQAMDDYYVWLERKYSNPQR